MKGDALKSVDSVEGSRLSRGRIPRSRDQRAGVLVGGGGEVIKNERVLGWGKRGGKLSHPTKTMGWMEIPGAFRGSRSTIAL